MSIKWENLPARCNMLDNINKENNYNLKKLYYFINNNYLAFKNMLKREQLVYVIA